MFFHSAMLFCFVLLVREIRNIQKWLSHAKASFAKHKISRNKEHIFCTKETQVSTLVLCLCFCANVQGDCVVTMHRWPCHCCNVSVMHVHESSVLLQAVAVPFQALIFDLLK